MALVLADRVLETTVVAGTGDASLGGAVLGYQPFSVIGGGNTTYYTIVAIDDNGAPTGDWEVGIGTYITTGNKISRDTVLSSSNGGALVYFPSGTKQIFLDLPSEEVTNGDVIGPASAVANNFAAFNLTTGKLIKDSGYNSASFATAAQGAKADTAVQPGSLGTAAYLNAGSANGVATLDSGGKVPVSQIPALGDLNYQGTWDASSNTPTLTSSAGTKGFYYVVSVAGSTNLNGITDWKVGDWAVFNGSVWQKIDNTDAVTSVNGYTGTVVLTYSDVGAQPAGTYVTSVSATSPVTSTGGTTPTIAMPAATTSVSGYLTSTDWNTFNSKGGGDVVGPSSATDNAIARYDTTTGKLIQNSVITIDDAGNIAGADSVQFSGTIPTGTIPTGTLYFDNSNNSLNFQQNAITQQIGEEIFIYGKASAAITEGQLICKTGAVGASGVITFGPSPANLTDNDGIIGVATENIALNGFGRITTFGIVHGINTTGSSVGETWADGDTLWYNPAGSGKLTNVKPTAPNIKFSVGTVTHAGSGGSGSIQVAMTPGSVLGGTDANVQLGTPSNGQILTYDGSATYWKNTSLTAGTAISVSTSSGGVLTIANTAPDQTVALANGTGISVTGTYPNFTITNTAPSSGGTVTSVTGTAPVVSSGGTTPAISMAKATGSVDGYLSSTDWTTFNSKGSGTVTSVTATSPVTSTGGATPVIAMPAATTSVSGYLISTDWTTFNGKYSVGGALGTPSSGTLTNCTGLPIGGISATGTPSSTTYLRGDGTWSTVSGGVTSVTGTAPVVSSGGATPAISMAAANTTTNGYLTSTDWNTFNGKGSGTVTSITAGTYLTGGTITGSGTIAVDATNLNTVSKVVARDASGNFSAGTITANLTGNASGSAATFTSTTQDSQFNSVGVGVAGSGTAGQIRATGSITAFSSDKRLKDNIKPIDSALAKVEKLNGFTFTWNNLAGELCKSFDNDIVESGVFAQEVQDVLPEAVRPAPFDTQYIDGVAQSISGENYLTVQYEKLVPLLIEAIKELKAEVDSLKGK